MVKRSLRLIIIGLILLIFSLMLMLEPYFTYAQIVSGSHPCRISLDPPDTLFELENMNPGDVYSRTIKVHKLGHAPANLWLSWNFIDGSRVFDTNGNDVGTLFEHMKIIIKYKGQVLYNGRMDGEALKSLFVDLIYQGDILKIEITVILPGPETDNKYQGASLKTQLVFYTRCSDGPGEWPAINIEKATNGVDADVPTGPFIPVGSQVTWTYVVTNTGNVPLHNIIVTDNIPGVSPVYVSGDSNGNGILDLGEIWIYRATGTAIAGQYANRGTVVGTSPRGQGVTDSDPSHYYGILPDKPAIKIEKATNGVDADLPTGPYIDVGDPVTWTYEVTNPGNVPLRNIVVTDNVTGVNPVYISGDANRDGILQPGETWIYRATGTAKAGQYSNTGRVVGTPPTGPNVSDSDPSHYFGKTVLEEIIFDPEIPQVSPDDPDVIAVIGDEIVVNPPLPRTDGASLGLFFLGLLFLIIGLILRKSLAENTSTG